MLPLFLSAQSQPVLVWQNTLGGSSYDQLWDLVVLPGSGALLAGWSQSPISGDKTEESQGASDYWLIRIGMEGELLWQRAIGGSGTDRLTSILHTADGGYLLAGDSDSPASGDKTEDSHGQTDFWVVKTDSLGQIEWQQTIGGLGFEYDPVVLTASDSTFLLGGYSNSDSSGNKTEHSRGGYDYWVLELTSAGEILWDKTIGGASVDILLSIDQLTDGGFILGGYSDSDASGEKTEDSQGGSDIWTVKILTGGMLDWQNTLGGSDDDWLNVVSATSDGGCLLGGSSYSGISGDKDSPNQGAGDWWLLKLDAFGQVEWQKGIGGDGHDATRAIVPDPDGGYLLGGSSASGASGNKTLPGWGGFDYWLVHIDDEGGIEWQQAYGGDDNDILLTVEPVGSTEYFVGGYSASGMTGNKSEPCQGFNDYWVLYLDELTAVRAASVPGSSWQIYPNPVTDRFYLRGNPVFPLQLTDIFGRTLITWEVESADDFFIAHLTPGVYFLKDRHRTFPFFKI